MVLELYARRGSFGWVAENWATSTAWSIQKRNLQVPWLVSPTALE